MHLSADGLSLWYDTTDEPGPADQVVGGPPAELKLSVAPASLANSVLVWYRLDGGAPRSFPARAVSSDARGVQSFRATFPRLDSPQVVEYSPVLRIGALQLPDKPFVDVTPSSFRVLPVASNQPASGAPKTSTTGQGLFEPMLDHVTRVEATLSAAPEQVGENPEGLRINFFVDGGTMRGPKLNGSVHKRGIDSMLIRRDGIGLVRVRAVMETDDGALIDADYNGILELGADGFERAKRGEFPELSALQLVPRLLTGHATYEWLNRAQFLGIGRVVGAQHLVQYDLFAINSMLSPRGG